MDFAYRGWEDAVDISVDEGCVWGAKDFGGRRASAGLSILTWELGP